MKNKILIFSIGLVAGLTIGVLFSVAIKELIVQFKELHLSLNKINLKQSELSQRLDSIQGKLIPDNKKAPNINKPNTAKIIPANAEKSPSSLQHNIKPLNSIKSDTVNAPAANEDSDVVVMTNQLVSVLAVHLHNDDSNTLSQKNRETDSALASMSDVDNPPKPSNYRVEFWKSPLNYKGYKMSSDKIVLYGIDPNTPVSLTIEKGAYYLLVNKGAYKLDFTDDYRPYEKVTDKTILKKLGI